MAVQGHLLLSMVLVANAVVLVRRAGEPDDPLGRRPVATPTATRLLWVLAAATAVAIVTGTVVTGAGPHAGDEEVERLDITVAAAARVHGIVVIVALAVAVATAIAIRGRPEDRRTVQGPLGDLDLHRPAAGGHRLHAVLQRGAGGARRRPRRRGDGALGGHRLARHGGHRAGHRAPRRRPGPGHRLTVRARIAAAVLLIATAARARAATTRRPGRRRRRLGGDDVRRAARPDQRPRPAGQRRGGGHRRQVTGRAVRRPHRRLRRDRRGARDVPRRRRRRSRSASAGGRRAAHPARRRRRAGRDRAGPRACRLRGQWPDGARRRRARAGRAVLQRHREGDVRRRAGRLPATSGARCTRRSPPSRRAGTSSSRSISTNSRTDPSVGDFPPGRSAPPRVRSQCGPGHHLDRWSAVLLGLLLAIFLGDVAGAQEEREPASRGR